MNKFNVHALDKNDEVIDNQEIYATDKKEALIVFLARLLNEEAKETVKILIVKL